ncbi:diacylglycerol kinase family protein [Sphingomonas sp. HITSZ_GF]|uniref:diacylglycerol/lipid kinase family protein n=1 Tax=Sphingomonas sp. HITSZ_GF TaxID=3037247 RepID=UPI00240E1D4D|nr:diacylglycerol kinase family protein [Sphingomonas sp. HITSZ_GF]MDG2534281.1 diacylglycerol kinase family protein [Sphingomonas sp. HITSZ_GF]
MERLWFITNPGSGSTTKAKCDALEAIFEERGLTLVGRTEFPAEELPKGAALTRKKVDTVVLFAGDGTINTTLCALANWKGSFLILPGGTMNLLAKSLHPTLDPKKIIEAAHDEATRVALPYIEAGENKAFVGLILGPATAWFRAREAARKGAIKKLFQAAHVAWNRTFGGSGIRIAGVPALKDRYQAVFVRPEEGELHVAAVDARDWGAIVQLGWEWMTGDWVAARAVSDSLTSELSPRGKKPVLALFDGEPVSLPPGTPIKAGMSRKAFIATREELG